MRKVTNRSLQIVALVLLVGTTLLLLETTHADYYHGDPFNTDEPLVTSDPYSRYVQTLFVDPLHEKKGGFARSVVMSHDGTTAAVARMTGVLRKSTVSGGVVVYSRKGTVWSQQGSILVGSDAVGDGHGTQGWSIDLSGNGNVLVSSAHLDDTRTHIENGSERTWPHGAFWVFRRNSASTWSQWGAKYVLSETTSNLHMFHDSLAFGRVVVISHDGSTIAVASQFRGAFVTVYGVVNEQWVQQGPSFDDVTNSEEYTYIDGFARNVALTGDGSIAVCVRYSSVAGYEGQGGFWVYMRNAKGVWNATAFYKTPSDSSLVGKQITISDRADRIILTRYEANPLFYVWNGDTYELRQVIPFPYNTGFNVALFKNATRLVLADPTMRKGTTFQLGSISFAELTSSNMWEIVPGVIYPEKYTERTNSEGVIRFGVRFDVSEDGCSIVVASPYHDDYVGAVWFLQQPEMIRPSLDNNNCKI